MENEDKSSGLQAKFNECDQRFKAIFSLTSAATKIIDHNLTIIEVNEALVDLLGYSKSELCGSKIMQFACEEYKAAWKDLQVAMWHHGKPFFKIDVCLKKKNGSVAWVHITTILFTESSEKYAYTVLDDFTYLKDYEESQKRLNMSLENSKMAVWELDLDTGGLIHSVGLHKILGLNKKLDDLGKSDLISSFIDEDSKAFKIILESIEQGTHLNFSGRISTSSGEMKWVNLQGKIGEGHLQKRVLLGTAQDISKEKISERYKDDFISIASHELKTPITVLSGTLQLMDRVDKGDIPRLSKLIDQANQSMSKVNVLIGDLLNASKMAEGQLHLHMSNFNISQAVEECCSHIDRAGKYRLIVEGDVALNIHADNDRIQQVIVNFVNNAIKYAPDGKDIRIRAKDEGNRLRISVIDSGPGINAEKSQHLFDRYYRVDSEGSQYSGLGLGLYISSEIIKKHKGEIGVNSKPGIGSEFWFTLPKAQS
jgi:two-component system CheB/CheR fusion protein